MVQALDKISYILVFLNQQLQITMTSAILSNLAETYPEVLTNPESILGPNHPKVLEFWIYIEGLSADEKKAIADHYWTLDYNERESASNAARDAAEEVVGVKFRTEALYAARDVTGWFIFSYATLELIGDVENMVTYDLIMSHKNS
jgi:hypothetical protein